MKNKPQGEAKPSVFIIDDDRHTCEMMSDILNGRGFHCAWALDAKKGLEKMKEVSPDLLLLDIQLPDLSGFDVCRMLTKIPALSKIPVVITTGRTITDTE